MRRLLFAPPARRDLDAIYAYIAQDNPRRAESFVIELRVRAEGLVDFPFSCPAFGRRGWRKAVHENYVILYSITDRELRVRRFIHGATRR